MVREISILSLEDLENIRHYAELRYSLTQIATMLTVDVGQLRLAILNPKSDVAMAYNSGKLQSSVKRREVIFEHAEKGELWAIKMLDMYEIDQREDELMP